MRTLIFAISVQFVVFASARAQAPSVEGAVAFNASAGGVAQVVLEETMVEVEPGLVVEVLEPIFPQEALDEHLDNRIFRDASVGLQLVDLGTGDELFAHRADEGLTPASTMKVLTAAAALRELGPAYRFNTRIFRSGEVDGAGTLDGDLHIQGGGDPTLVIERLWKLVYDLKLEGIERISGDVFFDDSHFDDRTRISGWNKPVDIRRGPAYFAPIGALSLNFNTVATVISPGLGVGDLARVSLETNAPGIAMLESEIVTGSARSRRRIHIERTVDGSSVTLTVTGSIPAASDAVRYYRTVPDPTAYFMAAFEWFMESQGIEVDGGFSEALTPADLPMVAQLQSPPLAAILMDMNKYSSNFIAEQVLKEIGAHATDSQGSTLKGLQVISDYLGTLGISESEFVIVNGSGLSRQTVLRPRHLTAVLVDMASDPTVSSEFTASLAIGGRDGTLWSRFRDDSVIGRVRGKTGTINGVHGLVGYLHGEDGQEYAFAYLVNNLRGSVSRARQAHEQFIGILLSPTDTRTAGEP
jgi:D-alanyl-D-alanine carboxypeptidase/D-alanyl-D-alanine-endopeptidase (penicillin-binding protein 4)